jgi:hypothetical protein
VFGTRRSLLTRSRTRNPLSRDNPDLRMSEYTQVISMINLLTDVRFKLAALIPALSGAAVALIISTDDITAIAQAMLGIGGFVFALGIVIYDLRNSQIYNGAIGRAMALEKTLFDRYGGDCRTGLFGSRADTNDTHRARGTDRFFRLHVDHGTALTLVYTATLTAWVWVVVAAGIDWLATQSWFLSSCMGGVNVDVAGAIVTLFAAAVLWKVRRKHDPPK